MSLEAAILSSEIVTLILLVNLLLCRYAEHDLPSMVYCACAVSCYGLVYTRVHPCMAVIYLCWPIHHSTIESCLITYVPMWCLTVGYILGTMPLTIFRHLKSETAQWWKGSVLGPKWLANFLPDFLLQHLLLEAVPFTNFCHLKSRFPCDPSDWPVLKFPLTLWRLISTYLFACFSTDQPTSDTYQPTNNGCSFTYLDQFLGGDVSCGSSLPPSLSSCSL